MTGHGGDEGGRSQGGELGQRLEVDIWDAQPRRWLAAGDPKTHPTQRRWCA